MVGKIIERENQYEKIHSIKQQVILREKNINKTRKWFKKYQPDVSLADQAWTATLSPGTPTAPILKMPSNLALGWTPR